jgi:hypothetical protein
MLKRWHIVSACLLVLYVVWIHWWASSGYIVEGSICDTYDPPKNCENHNILFYSAWTVGKALDRWSTLITALATVVIGLFTFTLWTSNRQLLKTTNQSINLARDEFLSTHRPKLRVRQFVLDLPTPENPLVVHFATVNVGATPANWRNIAAEVALWNGRSWEAPGVHQIVESINHPPIKSGQRLQVAIRSRFNISAEQIRAIEKGSLVVCAVGELTYADSSGVMRRTGFRRNYDIGADMFTASPNKDQEYED